LRLRIGQSSSKERTHIKIHQQLAEASCNIRPILSIDMETVTVEEATFLVNTNDVVDKKAFNKRPEGGSRVQKQQKIQGSNTHQSVVCASLPK
jgi:hypothetical protein